MTTNRQFDDAEGYFGGWTASSKKCHVVVPISGLPCGHPVEYRVWESSDGAYEDEQYRCLGGGHTWWVDGIDS
jgi:hypothetical protein